MNKNFLHRRPLVSPVSASFSDVFQNQRLQICTGKLDYHSQNIGSAIRQYHIRKKIVDLEKMDFVKRTIGRHGWRKRTGVENVSDHETIGPRKFLRLPENILSFRSKKEFIGWPDINVNFSLAENIFNLRMAKTDALINRTPPPSTPWRNVGDIWRIIRDFVTNLPPRRGITTVWLDHCCLCDK